MKVLFVDTVHSLLWKGLTKNGYECVEGYDLSKEEIQQIVSDFHGIIIRSRFNIDSTFLDACNNLKFIARSGSGLENIDVHYAEQKGIKCFNAPEGNAQAVAEHALGMLLSLFNNLNKVDSEVRSGIWKREENRGHELSGKTIGIIGYGNNGSAFAKVLQGFGCTVLAYDKYLESFNTNWAEQVELQVIFQKADVLSLHIPLTEETTFLFNDEYLGNFKKPIYLINTSRGKCVDTKTILRGLKSKKISGACLDVFDFEKTSFEQIKKSEALKELISTDKVILSSHIAGWTFESYERLSKILLSKILMNH